MNGWYKQNRNVFERPWAKDAKMVAVYAYLHCVAYVNDGMLHGQVIRRGSCPTSNTAIMEATGLTEQEVRTRLKKLLEYGEIIVKPTNYGKIVTVCDYDSCGVSNDLFELNLTTEQPTQEQPSTTPTTTPSNTPYIKEDRIIYNNNLRSRYTPSKKRESNKELALEIKAIYNKMFDGILRKWERLSADMIIKVDNCVNRFGRQSVDMVFDQVKHEKFSLGENNTGFIADFAFIFKLANYEAYLGRYELRLKQGTKKPVSTAAPEPQQPKIIPETIDKHEAPRQRPTSVERKQNLLDMIEYIQTNPRSIGCVQLEEAYRSGELAAYGIDWKPNNL